MYLLLLAPIADGFTSVSRHSSTNKESMAPVHLRLAEEDSVESFKDFLEVFRTTGETGT